MINSYQNSIIAQLLEAITGQINFTGTPTSNIGDILLSILEQTPYDKEPKSVLAELFLKLKDKLEGRAFTPYDKEPKSAIAEILLSILNETEYDKEPNSRVAELLLELKSELESYAELTASGAIANFTTSVVKPLVNLTAYFKATQEAGTPTPQSPKAISGVSAVRLGYADFNQLALKANVVSHGISSTIDTNGVISLSGVCDTSYANITQPISTIATGKVYLIGKTIVENPNNVAFRYSFLNSNTTPLVPVSTDTKWTVCKIDNTTGSSTGISGFTANTDFTGVKLKIICIDLTQALGVEKANYLHSLGSTGVEIARQLFKKEYYLPTTGGSLVTLNSVNGEFTTPEEVINLGDTYYGGYVSQDKNGKREFVVTHALFTCTGGQGETWEYYSVAQGNLFRRYFNPSVKNVSITSDNTLCDKYKPVYYSNRTNLTVSGAENRVDFINNDFSDLASFKAELANNPISIVFPIAEPFTVALPDGEPITAFNGVNNIYNDSGDTSVTYLAKIADNLNATTKLRAEVKAQMLKAKEGEKEIIKEDPIEEIKEPVKDSGETKKGANKA